MLSDLNAFCLFLSFLSAGKCDAKNLHFADKNGTSLVLFGYLGECSCSENIGDYRFNNFYTSDYHQYFRISNQKVSKPLPGAFLRRLLKVSTFAVSK